MYLITEVTEQELPLATTDTLCELALLCHAEIPVVCRIIRQKRTTRKYKNIPSHIYKIPDEIE